MHVLVQAKRIEIDEKIAQLAKEQADKQRIADEHAAALKKVAVAEKEKAKIQEDLRRQQEELENERRRRKGREAPTEHPGIIDRFCVRILFVISSIGFSIFEYRFGLCEF